MSINWRNDSYGCEEYQQPKSLKGWKRERKWEKSGKDKGARWRDCKTK